LPETPLDVPRARMFAEACRPQAQRREEALRHTIFACRVLREKCGRGRKREERVIAANLGLLALSEEAEGDRSTAPPLRSSKAIEQAKQVARAGRGEQVAPLVGAGLSMRTRLPG
jgi:hypothetical protein